MYSIAAGDEFSMAIKAGGALLLWGAIPAHLADYFLSAAMADASGDDGGNGSGLPANFIKKDQLFRQGPVPDTVICIHPVPVPGFEDMKLLQVGAQANGRCVAITTRLEVVEWTIQMVHRDKNGKDEIKSNAFIQRDALKGNFGVAHVRGLQHVAVSSVACGKYHTIALSCAGSLYGWGSNEHGQLGRPTGKNSSSETTSGAIAMHVGPGIYCRIIACGDDHTLLLVFNSTAGQQQLLSCGADHRGQLGKGNSDSKSLHSSSISLVRFFGEFATSSINSKLSSKEQEVHLSITAIAAGGNSSFCLTDTGTAFSWGENQHGQLGHGDTNLRSNPVSIQAFVDVGVRVENICCSGDCTAAVSTAGNVYTWGQIRNQDQQLNRSDYQYFSSHSSENMMTCELAPRLVELFAAKNLRIAGVWAGRGNQFISAIQSLNANRRNEKAMRMHIGTNNAIPSASQCLAFFANSSALDRAASTSELHAELLQFATVGEWTSCTIELRDFKGDYIRVGGWRLSAFLYHSEREKHLQRDKHSLTPETDTDILDNDDGTYLVRFRSTITGIHQLHVRLHDRILLSTSESFYWEKNEVISGEIHIQRSPFQVLVSKKEVLGVASDHFNFDISWMSNSKITLPSEQPIAIEARKDRAIAAVRVTLKEENASKGSHDSDAWQKLTLSAKIAVNDEKVMSAERLECHIQQPSRDRFLISYPLNHIGKFTLSLFARILLREAPESSHNNTGELLGSPFVYTVNPGPLDAEKSRLLRKEQEQAQGKENAWKLVEAILDVRDACGNVVTEDIRPHLIVDGQLISSRSTSVLKTVVEAPCARISSQADEAKWRIIMRPSMDAHQLSLSVKVHNAATNDACDISGSPLVIDLASENRNNVTDGLKAKGWLLERKSIQDKCTFCSSCPSEPIQLCLNIEPCTLQHYDDLPRFRTAVESQVSVQIQNIRTGSVARLETISPLEWKTLKRTSKDSLEESCHFKATAPSQIGVYIIEISVGNISTGQLVLSVVDKAIVYFHENRRVDTDENLFNRSSPRENFYFVFNACQYDEPGNAWLAEHDSLNRFANEEGIQTINQRCLSRDLLRIILPRENLHHDSSWYAASRQHHCRSREDDGGKGIAEEEIHINVRVAHVCVVFDPGNDCHLQQLVGQAQKLMPLCRSRNVDCFTASVRSLAFLVSASLAATPWDEPTMTCQKMLENIPYEASSIHCVLAPIGNFCREVVAASRRGIPVLSSCGGIFTRVLLFKYLCDSVGIKCGIDLYGGDTGDTYVWVLHESSDENTRECRYKVDLLRGTSDVTIS